MRSLFAKIFISFWLIVTLAGVTMAVLALLNQPREDSFSAGHRHFVSTALSGIGAEVSEALECGGAEALQSYSASLREEGLGVFLLTRQGEDIAGGEPDAAMVQLAQKALRSSEVQRARPMRGRILMAQALHLPGQHVAALVVELNFRRPPPGNFFDRIAKGQVHGQGLMVFMVIGGIICFFLARSLTAPIRKLRLATQRFAGGELSTRVSQEIRGKNEIADLARDFDGMAERIEALISSRNRLLRDISHELRSPLARLNVALELSRQQAGEGATASLNRIEREAERLNDLIGQLLTLTLLETGADRLTNDPVDLQDLVSEVVADADFEARNSNRQVRLLEVEPLRVEGSAEMLRRAVENVVRNALRYTAEGSAVEVSLASSSEPESGTAVIRVRDFGPGVSEEALGKLFQPFYRVEDARDRQSGGTGIGLAITERAVRLHGGTVRAFNAQGGGLGVEITIPVG